MTKSVIIAGLVLGATILCGITVNDAFGAVDYFWKIKGVEGESEKPGHENEIDVLAWSWGLSQSGSSGAIDRGEGGRANLEDLSVTKFIDSSTVSLLGSCCRGNPIPEVELLFFDSDRSNLVPYLKYKMTSVLVTSYSTGGSGEEDRLTENVSLNYAKFEIVYNKLADPADPGQSVTLGKRPTRG